MFRIAPYMQIVIKSLFTSKMEQKKKKEGICLDEG